MSTCQVAEDSTAKDDIMPRKKRHDRDSTCLRCKTATGNIVIRHCVYCKECFLHTVALKFRRALAVLLKPSGSRKTRPKDAEREMGNVLLGFSGGIGSSILLDMVSKRYTENADDNMDDDGKENGGWRRPPAWKSIRVAHIEHCGAFTSVPDRTCQVEALMERYPEFELISLRLEDAFDPAWWTSHNLSDASDTSIAIDPQTLRFMTDPSQPSTPSERLKLYLSSLPTPTATQYAIGSLSRLLLQHTALAHRCSHILLGTSLTSLSISLISSISQGGGFHSREEREELWRGIRISRPLRDVGAKEAAAYLWWRKLDVIPRPPSLQEEMLTNTIQRLTHDFIMGLDRDFPSTVSAISKTLEKVEPKGQSVGICTLCQRPVQAGLQEWNASMALRALPSTVAGAEITEDAEASSSAYLCYSCYTTWASRSTRSRPATTNAVPLPLWVSLTANAPSPKPHDSVQNGLRDQIKDFLLDDAS